MPALRKKWASVSVLLKVFKEELPSCEHYMPQSDLVIHFWHWADQCVTVQINGSYLAGT